MAQEEGTKCVMIETSQGESLEYYISSHPRLTQNNDKVTLTVGEETKEFGTVDIKKVYTSIATIKVVYKLDGEVYKTYYHHAGIALKSEPAPTKEGYSFSGWDNEPTTMPDHDITITGSFSINSYKLTYQVDGEVYKTSDVEYGSKITAESAPTKEGYTFSGWSEIPETMPAHDVTITGTFAVNSYKLIYLVDGEVYKNSYVEFGSAKVRLNGTSSTIVPVGGYVGVVVFGGLIFKNIESGLQPNEKVSVYGFSGELIFSRLASLEGKLTISTSELTQGAYIIKTNRQTIKITRK